jgi:predicted RNase H-like HicB family nuclease
MELAAMNYPIVIHKDKDSDYGVTVPDLPGCFSAGRTLDEAVAMAKEAIELHLEGVVREGMPLPEPGSIESHRLRRQYRGGTWAVVAIDPSALPLTARRVNISIPRPVLAAVDRCAAEEGETRSGLLVKAVTLYMRGRGPAKGRRRTRTGKR